MTHHQRATDPRSAPRVAALAAVALAVAAMPLMFTGSAAATDGDTTETVSIGPAPGASAGQIPSHFVGLSIEWSLIERYMGPNARPAFTNLLTNLGSGVLRIGGSSQDLMAFDESAANTNRVITPEDLANIRLTLDSTRTDDLPGWKTVLGTAMAPVTASRPFVSPEHTRAFIERGVKPAFAGADDEVAGVELGNEPDLTYHYNLAAYLADYARWNEAGAASPYNTITPATSEQIATWRDMRDSETLNTRFFWDWPEILDTTSPRMRADAGPLGAWAADHFYPLARTCASDPYRCPTISALLDRDRTESLAYNTYVHAGEAAKRGLGYRLEEINTAAGRGADGVSNVAASAIWALDTMFNVACPDPPDNPGANVDCGTHAVGVNFHNAEVNAFWKPEEGNAYYNAINFDPSNAMGGPTAAPEYYAMLLFSRFAQGTKGLQPVATNPSGAISAWRLQGNGSERRVFLINKSDHPVDVELTEPGTTYLLDRMSPRDPNGTGRKLDAPQMMIDGRQVASDGIWPGFRPEQGMIADGKFAVHLGVGEAVVARVLG